MADILKKFGRYFLLDLIAQGGMAEIYRARLASPDGAGRLMVIKRIQAGFGNNSEFLKMFRSEIKVTMGFNHPNIVQLYDFGEEQAQPFIAMELVDGKNLRQFMTRFSELKKPFPVDLAVYIIEQAASGLHYAHSYKDKISGQPLSIVHRDVSPQNVLVSYEGTIKVIDFGIAKAATNSESTRAGVIKGKPSYLSPEQICGEQLDGRSDIFALGVVLWELLVGRKLFAGDNDLAVLKLIESSQTYIKPPSTHNSAVPKDLDYIVMKALSKQRDKRYQTAEELQRALHRFLYSYAPDFNPTDLSYVAKDLFKNEIVKDRKRIQKLNEEVEKLLITSELAIPPPPPGLDDTDGTITDTSEGTKHTNSLVPSKASANPPREPDRELGTNTVEFTEFPEIADSKVKPAPQAARSARTSANRPRAESRTRTQRTQTRTEKIFPNKAWLGTAGYAAAAVLLLAYFAPAMGFKVPGLSSWLGSASAIHFPQNPIHTAGNIPKIPAKGRSVVLQLNIIPMGKSTSATINGQALDMDNPQISVPVDSPLDLVVQNPEFKTVERQFVVDSAELGDQNTYEMDVEMDPLHYGYLSLKTTPNADVSIMIDGIPWKKRTPFEREKLPVGKYSIHLKNDLLEMDRTLTVEIHEGELTQPFDPDREASREIELNPERLPSSTRQ